MAGEPRNAAVNLDSYRILQRHRAVFRPQYGVLIHISDSSNAEITHSMLIFIIIYLNTQAVNKTNNMPCYRKDDRAMHPAHIGYSTLILFTPMRPLLCADLTLNEFKQVAFRALIGY